MYVHSRYTKVGRGFWDSVKDGKIVIDAHEKNKSDYGVEKTEYIIKDGDVSEVMRHESFTDKNGKKGKKKTHVIYGIGCTTWVNGKVTETEKYKPGSNQARIFKGEWKKQIGKLEHKYPGVLTQKCYGGGFRKETFTYGTSPKSKKIAYQVSYGSKKLKIVYPNGKEWFNIICHNGDKIAFGWKPSIMDITDKEKSYWRTGGRVKPEKYDYNKFTNHGNYEVELFDTEGKIDCKGRVENRQKVGEWIENYETIYYLSGVPVSKKLFFSKPDELDPKEVLAITNVQLRTSLMQKVGTERILQKCEGKIIDTYEDSELWELPMAGTRTSMNRNSRDGDATLKLLKVKDPSTGTFYTLRVPPDSMKCEEARKWTFGYNLEEGKEVEFVAET